jgi:hypothetical protein
VQRAVVVDPSQEYSPSCIVNGFRKVVVFDHIADLEVFIGNHIARGDERVCRFPGKIFTLPGDLQMRFCYHLASFLAVATLLLLPRELALQPLESLLCFAIVAWVLHRLTVAIGQERLETDINPCLPARWNMLNVPLCLDTELDVVAIGAADETDTLDVLDGECGNLQFGIPIVYYR